MASPTASSASRAAASALSSTVAAKPMEPSRTTWSPTPISVSSTVVSTRPSRRATNWERILSILTSAWLHPRAAARSRAADRTSSRGSPSRPAEFFDPAELSDPPDITPGPQPPEMSWTLFLPALMKGIMARSSAPTFSMGWSAPAARSSSKWWRPDRFSSIHSWAKAPERMSSRI